MATEAAWPFMAFFQFSALFLPVSWACGPSAGSGAAKSQACAHRAARPRGARGAGSGSQRATGTSGRTASGGLKVGQKQVTKIGQSEIEDNSLKVCRLRTRPIHKHEIRST